MTEWKLARHVEQNQSSFDLDIIALYSSLVKGVHFRRVQL